MRFSKKDDDTTRLEQLLAEHRKRPSQHTVDEMFALFLTVPLYYSSLKPEPGPDHFPYLNMKLRGKNEPQTTLKGMAEQALEQGFGVTITQSGKKTDWVFSLGDLIFLARNGVLLSSRGSAGMQSIRLEEDAEVQVGTPGEDILPMAVRKHLRAYIQTALKIKDPKFYLMHNPHDDPPWTIMFNFSRKDFGSDAEYQNAFGRLSWFFPKFVFTGCSENDLHEFYEI